MKFLFKLINLNIFLNKYEYIRIYFFIFIWKMYF